MTRSAHHPDPPSAHSFVEHMGRVARADGLPRIAGRLFGFLILHAGPYSFTQLAAHLDVSRGSISTNTRRLEQLGLVERVSRPGDRQDYYQLPPAPYSALLRGAVERTGRARAGVAQARDELPADWHGAKARLLALETFYDRVGRGYQTVIRDYDADAGDDADG